MKTKINLMKTTVKVIVALLLLVVTPACLDNAEILDCESDEILLKSKRVYNGPIQLEGFSRLAYFVKVDGEFIFDEISGTYYDGYENNFLISKAELTFGEGKSFKLSSTDYVDFDLNPETVEDRLLFRKITFSGMITPGGQLKFTWPDKWEQFDFLSGGLVETQDILGQMALHTGITLSGPGISKNTIALKGNFGGDMFFADCRLNGHQEQPGIFNPFDKMHKGPILVHPILELEVAE